MIMVKKSEEKLLKEWNRLYDSAFPSLKRKYDEVCELFTDWNIRKIDTETAIRKLNLMVKNKVET